MKFAWPGGVAGRIALVLALSLLAVQIVTAPYFLREQARLATEVYDQSTQQRIKYITTLFDALNHPQRRELLPALHSPTLAVELYFDAPDHCSSDAENFDYLTQLSETLRRELQYCRVPTGEEPPLMAGLFTSRELVALWAPLADGTWLRFVTASALPSLGWIAHVSAQVLLVILSVVVFALWAARQITRPMRTFSQAADRLSRDVNAPPLPEEGGVELRRATHAFNRMQGTLQRYVEDRTRMLAAISHDLRTSLTRLRLRTAYISDPEQQRRAEQDIEDMDAMLGATLSFARDDGTEEPQCRVDLAAMLQSLCDDLQDGGQQASYTGPTQQTYDCRPISLQRAFSNLANNAASYGGSAEISLEVRDNEVRVEFCDRGPGIPEASREHVMEPFVRLDAARNRETGGTGLGLSIAQSAIRQHGGTLSLHDREGGGLRVLVTLPGSH